MKHKTTILTLMLLVMALMLQGKSFSTGGFGGFTFSAIYNNYDNLNSNLQNTGYSPIAKGVYFGMDGIGYGIINSIILGGSSVSSKTSSENANNSLTITSEGGYFDIGYLFSPLRYLDLFPLIGFGSMNYSVSLRPSIGDTYFDSLLVDPGRVSTINKTSFSVAVSGNILIKIPIFSQYSFVGFLLGGGYTISPSFGAWQTADGSHVNNGPEMPMGFPFARLSIVFGGGVF